jgi:hypothetical protein
MEHRFGRFAGVGAVLVAVFLVVAPAAPLCAADMIDYRSYGEILKKYVDENGMIDYKSLKANRGALDAFVKSLAQVPTAEFRKWSNDEQIAFWINAYNALTLQVIIDHYPIQAGGFISSLRFPDNSIRQIGGVWDKITWTVAGMTVALGDIEHKRLREQHDKPGIHMALVCASMSCPQLRREPYTGYKIDQQLDAQAKRFLRKPDRFRIARENRLVLLSPIFKWYDQDYVSRHAPDSGFPGQGKKQRAVLNYIAQYIDAKGAEYLRTQRYRIEYLDYDWSLYEQ